MAELTIRTNNIPRNVICGFDLTEAEQKEFDWIDFTQDDGASHSFFRYKRQVYSLGEFMRCRTACGFNEWDGYHGNSAFSGTLVRYVDHGERVIVGQYFS